MFQPHQLDEPAFNEDQMQTVDLLISRTDKHVEGAYTDSKVNPEQFRID